MSPTWCGRSTTGSGAPRKFGVSARSTVRIATPSSSALPASRCEISAAA
jgi:hypothetical protein